MDEQQILDALKELTHYSHISLEKRCNTAIKKALTVAKKNGFTRLFIQDEGGWITYKQFGEKLGFDIIPITTNTGLIDPTTLDLNSTDVVLIHALAGYHSLQPLKQIREVCDNEHALFIEDCCGAPHVEHFGHILVCSFGNAKPINFGKGGFYATNDETLFEKTHLEEEYVCQELLDKITHVTEHLNTFYKIREELRQKYKSYSPIADQYGIILLVPFSDDEQKNDIIQKATEYGVEYEECPRYIRTNSSAISLEIKRL